VPLVHYLPEDIISCRFDLAYDMSQSWVLNASSHADRAPYAPNAARDCRTAGGRDPVRRRCRYQRQRLVGASTSPYFLNPRWSQNTRGPARTSRSYSGRSMTTPLSLRRTYLAAQPAVPPPRSGTSCPRPSRLL
jgi:hypothetical protein